MYAKRIETYGDLRPLSNDERMAQWAARYFSAGLHRNPENSSASPYRDGDLAAPVRLYGPSDA